MPDRLALVKGPPAPRRAHLDRLVAALWPARAEFASGYARTLAQRNALIGRIRRGGGREQLGAWDRELATRAVPLVEARALAAAELAEPFSTAAAALGLERDAELRYRPATADLDAAGIAAELASRHEADVARGYTIWGPHRDELELRLAGRAVRRYGSQGQQRLTLLALLFAERETLQRARRTLPLMLLDDVMSELDPDRRRRLVEAISAGGQVLITATEAEHVPELGGAARAGISVRAGRGRGGGCVSERPTRGPRPLGDSLARVLADSAPRTLLAEVQAAWPQACGEAIAQSSEPVAERSGTVTIACRNGAWAQELELMQEALLERLESVIGADRVAALRFTADLSRHR